MPKVLKWYYHYSGKALRLSCEQERYLSHAHFCLLRDRSNLNYWLPMIIDDRFKKWRIVELFTVTSQLRKDKTIQFCLLRRVEGNSFPKTSFQRQTSKDVIVVQNLDNAEKEMDKVLSRMFPDEEVHSIITEQVRVLNAQELTDNQVKDLAKESEHRPNIFMKAMDDSIPDGCTEEVGLCENNNFSISKEEEKREESALKQRVFKAIEDQLWSTTGKTLLKTGFTKAHVKQYEILLKSNWAAFGDPEAVSRMSDLTPFPAFIKPGHEPCLPRRTIPLTADQQEWLKGHLEGMMRKGILVPVKNPTHGSAVFLVPKKGPKKWRMVTDMPPLNKITQRTPFVMPLLESMLANVGEARIFAGFDALSGFDLLRTSSDIFILITPIGAFQMKCAPMGWVNTPQIFQNRMETEVLLPAGILNKKDDGAEQWIDDTLIHGTTPTSFISSVANFLKAIQAVKARLNVQKCEFLKHEIKWCGRLISHRKWTMDRKYYDRILQVGRPTYVDELQQAFYVANWLAPTIPRLSKYREYFKGILNLHGEKARVVKKRNERVMWTPALISGWKDFLREIYTASQTFMQNYDPRRGLGIMCDASDLYWSCVIVQLEDPTFVEGTSFDDLKIKPMLFLSGEFKGSETRWHISQKELYPILQAFERFGFLLLTHEFPIQIFTDHKNLIHILRPEWEPAKSGAHRLARWATKIQSADTNTVHIPGKKNVLADLLSRWGSPHNDMPENLPALTDTTPERTLTTKSKVQAEGRILRVKPHLSNEEEERLDETLNAFDKHRVSFLNPYYRGGFEQLTAQEILNAQQETQTPKGAYLCEKENVFKVGEKVWIPKNLQERLIVHNHIACYHNNLETELNYLRDYKFENCTQSEVIQLVKSLRRVCVHCQRSPTILKRPYKVTEIPSAPREVLTMDYLYVKDKSYFLVLTDVFSRKISLSQTTSADTESAVQAMLEFRGSYGLAEEFVLVTDQGSHFASEVMKDLSRELRYTHKFSVAYCPWQNGAAEVANKRVLRHLRQLCSEYSLQLDDWKRTIPIIEHVVNNLADESKNRRSPNEIFLGFKYKPTLSGTENYKILIDKILSAPRNAESVEGHIVKLGQELETVLGEQYEYIQLSRKRARELANKSRKYILQFQPGDWVMVSTSQTQKDLDKTRLKWSGPQLIVEVISDDVYKVRNLKGKTEVVHASRMWYYDNSTFKPGPEVTNVFNHDFGRYMIKAIVDYRRKKGATLLKIQWLGFEREHDSWEPLEQIAETNLEDVIYFFEKKKMEFPPDLKKAITGKILQQKLRRARMELSRDKQPVSTGWLPIEKEALRCAVIVHGVGEYKKLQSALPGKSFPQIQSKLQQMLGTKNLEQYEGLHLDINDVSVFNSTIGEKERQAGLTKAERKQENRLRFELPTELRLVEIPVVKELHELGAVDSNLVPKSVKESFEKLKPSWSVLLMDIPVCLAVLSRKQSIKPQKTFVNKIGGGANLVRIDVNIKPNLKECLEEFRFGQLNVVKSKVTYIDQENGNEFELQRKTFFTYKVIPRVLNHKNVEGECRERFTLHLGKSNFIQLSYNHDRELERLREAPCKVLHVGLRWQVGKGNPLCYLQENAGLEPSDIECLRLDKMLALHGILILWTPVAYLARTMAFYVEKGLTFEKTLTWVKLGPTGKVRSFMGYYANRGTETALVFSNRGTDEETSQIVDKIGLIEELYLGPGTKPITLLARVARKVKGKCADLN